MKPDGWLRGAGEMVDDDRPQPKAMPFANPTRRRIAAKGKGK